MLTQNDDASSRSRSKAQLHERNSNNLATAAEKSSTASTPNDGNNDSAWSQTQTQTQSQSVAKAPVPQVSQSQNSTFSGYASSFFSGNFPTVNSSSSDHNNNDHRNSNADDGSVKSSAFQHPPIYAAPTTDTLGEEHDQEVFSFLVRPYTVQTPTRYRRPLEVRPSSSSSSVASFSQQSKPSHHALLHQQNRSSTTKSAPSVAASASPSMSMMMQAALSLSSSTPQQNNQRSQQQQQHASNQSTTGASTASTAFARGGRGTAASVVSGVALTPNTSNVNKAKSTSSLHHSQNQLQHQSSQRSLTPSRGGISTGQPLTVSNISAFSVPSSSNRLNKNNTTSINDKIKDPSSVRKRIYSKRRRRYRPHHSTNRPRGEFQLEEDYAKVAVRTVSLAQRAAFKGRPPLPLSEWHRVAQQVAALQQQQRGIGLAQGVNKNVAQNSSSSTVTSQSSQLPITSSSVYKRLSPS